jgi:hypothetical protein
MYRNWYQTGNDAITGLDRRPLSTFSQVEQQPKVEYINKKAQIQQEVNSDILSTLTSVRQTGVTLFTGDHIRLVPWRALWVSLFALFALHPSGIPVLRGLSKFSMSDHPMLAKD